MTSLRLALAAAFIAALGIHSASALEVTDNSSNKAAANLTDPDDKTPVAHLDDDGTLQQPSSGFKLQMQGGNGQSPYNNSGPSAFDRAVDRFQQ